MIKRELSYGNQPQHQFNPRPIVARLNDALTETNTVYHQDTYDCEHNSIRFTVVAVSTRWGVGNVEMHIDETQFKTKAALQRFYREVKSLTIGTR